MCHVYVHKASRVGVGWSCVCMLVGHVYMTNRMCIRYSGLRVDALVVMVCVCVNEVLEAPGGAIVRRLRLERRDHVVDTLCDVTDVTSVELRL